SGIPTLAMACESAVRLACAEVRIRAATAAAASSRSTKPPTTQGQRPRRRGAEPAAPRTLPVSRSPSGVRRYETFATAKMLATPTFGSSQCCSAGPCARHVAVGRGADSACVSAGHGALGGARNQLGVLGQRHPRKRPLGWLIGGGAPGQLRVGQVDIEPAGAHV